MVSIGYDTEIVRVDAYRVLREKGTVRAVQYQTGALSVVPDEGTTPVTYLVGPECKITLGGEPVTDFQVSLNDGFLDLVNHIFENSILFCSTE